MSLLVYPCTSRVLFSMALAVYRMPMMSDHNFESLYARLGHRFNDPQLLQEALTHPSTANRRVVRNYERLEFLGDRVLGLVIADQLYHYFKDDTEGSLAKRLAFLVSKQPLIAIARQLELDQYIVMGRGVSSYDEPRRLSLLADACEAIIAALYLDAGLATAQQFIVRYWMPLFDDMTVTAPKDAKSTLQEWAQGCGNPAPEYVIIDQQGPDHAPFFTVEVYVEGLKRYRGQASSKRQAEQQAATTALQEINK